MTDAPANPLAIETRTGWPPDLRVLFDRYPRDVWPGHPNLGRLARFWLSIHDGFRHHGAALEASASDFREGLVTPQQFRANFAPRLQTFLSHLEGHHQIEDYEFFPRFGDAEPRLLRGFEILELDHGTIHHAMDRMADTANAFMAAEAGDRDAMLRAGDDYVASGEALIRLLGRHLEDEEDLIVPLILERSEAGLGL